MKKRISTLFLCAMIVVTAMSQKRTGIIYKASVDPVIDGLVDDVWAEAEAEHPMDINVADLDPTLEEPTSWQALYTDDGIFVLLRVTDDAFYPWYIVDGFSWEYDKPELYFDVNYTLVDGGGPSDDGGHYQVAPAFADGLNDGRLLLCDWNGEDGTIIQYAFLVEEPNFTAEYFIPFSELKDNDGFEISLIEEVGFDVTMVDRDPDDAGPRSAVWANNLGGDGSSWNNMDNCGIITFDGAEPPTFTESIELSAEDITENNGVVKVEAVILPAEANQTLAWSIVEAASTGRATINSEGVVTGIVDGDITVKGAAGDGSYVETEVILNISNQIVTRPEINRIRNGYFNDLLPGPLPAEWSNPGSMIVVDGVVNLDPEPKTNIWEYQMNQQGGWGLNATDVYVFSFVMWADQPDTFNVDFEDGRDAVGYQRLGESSHEYSIGGASDWLFQSPTEPTRFIFDVKFVHLLPESNETFQFMLGHHDPIVYIDSVELVNVNDLELLTPDYIAVEGITASGGSSVAVGETLQFSADVVPAEATLTGVNWKVIPGTGWATIDDAGLLTADTFGTVKVVAMAKDDSGVLDIIDVMVQGPVGVETQQVNGLKVYPNPAVSELNVVLTSDNSVVTIYNSVGRKMDEVVVSGTEHKFDINSYAAGIYFVRTDGAVTKFVK